MSFPGPYEDQVPDLVSAHPFEMCPNAPVLKYKRAGYFYTLGVGGPPLAPALLLGGDGPASASVRPHPWGLQAKFLATNQG